MGVKEEEEGGGFCNGFLLARPGTVRPTACYRRKTGGVGGGEIIRVQVP